MAFKVVVVAALVALVSAGMDADYMNYMQQMMSGGGQQMGGQQMGGQQMGGQQQQGGGCNPAMGGCQIPQGVDMGDYLQHQMQQQQYESAQMQEKIKAQFESVMQEVTMRKHRYAMGVMTEFTSLCACTQTSMQIYDAMFVQNAKNLNLTNVDDMGSHSTLPYQAKTAKEARELIFSGMFYTLCTSLGAFMEFAEQVNNNIPVFQNNGVTQPSI